MQVGAAPVPPVVVALLAIGGPPAGTSPNRGRDHEAYAGSPEDPHMPYPLISTDPARMGGVPCIRDTRIPVATVVAMVADGMGTDEILAAHPDLTDEDIAEGLRFTAEAVCERAIPPSSAP